jgi:hypothetical protein
MKNNCIFALHNFGDELCIVVEIKTLRIREHAWL